MNLSPAANTNTPPFAISRSAPMPSPIPRIRSDRNWRDLERSAPPIEPWTKSIIGGLLWVVFAVAGFYIADILARW